MGGSLDSCEEREGIPVRHTIWERRRYCRNFDVQRGAFWFSDKGRMAVVRGEGNENEICDELYELFSI